MSDIMTIDGHRAVIHFGPETAMFRGEFVGLTGSADFYADSVAGLVAEGAISFKVFLEVCREKGVCPTR